MKTLTVSDVVPGWLWSRLFLFLLSLLVMTAFTALGPAEKALGSHVRVVYLHGVWVWTSLAGFTAAGLVGLAGLVAHKEALNRWSLALGRTGLVFWITYLPISLWAMESNWNGLFLSEPRWRVAVEFAVAGILLQICLTLIEDLAWASAANLFYGIALLWALVVTQNVMHPASPILASDSWRIKVFFGGLFVLMLLVAAQVADGFHRLEQQVK
jgi:hypothetical protein